MNACFAAVVAMQTRVEYLSLSFQLAAVTVSRSVKEAAEHSAASSGEPFEVSTKSDGLSLAVELDAAAAEQLSSDEFASVVAAVAASACLQSAVE